MNTQLNISQGFLVLHIVLRKRKYFLINRQINLFFLFSLQKPQIITKLIKLKKKILKEKPLRKVFSIETEAKL